MFRVRYGEAIRTYVLAQKYVCGSRETKNLPTERKHFTGPAKPPSTVTDTNHLRDRIRQLDGGELTDIPSGYPYSIIFPRIESSPVVYATKWHAASSLLIAPDGACPIGMIGHCGLPSDEDLSGIAHIVRDHPAYFLGDCDPFDLLIFAWLRQFISIRFLGTSDAAVSALGVDVRESITIPLPEEERRAMTLVREVCPNFAQLIGPNCAQLLDGDRKLELEALVSFRTQPGSNLLSLLV